MIIANCAKSRTSTGICLNYGLRNNQRRFLQLETKLNASFCLSSKLICFRNHISKGNGENGFEISCRKISGLALEIRKFRVEMIKMVF